MPSVERCGFTHPTNVVALSYPHSCSAYPQSTLILSSSPRLVAYASPPGYCARANVAVHPFISLPPAIIVSSAPSCPKLALSCRFASLAIKSPLLCHRAVLAHLSPPNLSLSLSRTVPPRNLDISSSWFLSCTSVSLVASYVYPLSRPVAYPAVVLSYPRICTWRRDHPSCPPNTHPDLLLLPCLFACLELIVGGWGESTSRDPGTPLGSVVDSFCAVSPWGLVVRVADSRGGSSFISRGEARRDGPWISLACAAEPDLASPCLLPSASFDVRASCARRETRSRLAAPGSRSMLYCSDRSCWRCGAASVVKSCITR